jgi:hypothetical protein
MKTNPGVIREQLSYHILTDKHKPIHCFYRFKIYELPNYLAIAPEEKRKRLHYQIESSDVKVVIRFFLNERKEIFRARWFRLKESDSELSYYSVMYWINYLKSQKKFSVDFVLKTSSPF